MSERRINYNRPPERIHIQLEEPEDIWHAYHLIAPTDHVTANGSHRVMSESITGSTVSTRVYTKFTIAVKTIDFDPAASELHLSGQIVQENSLAKLGQHQTLHLKVSDYLKLTKPDGWDTVSLDVLRQLTDPRVRAARSTVAAAVIMQEGLAHICAITEHRTILKLKISAAIPRKRAGGSTVHDERVTRFFNQIWTSLSRQVNAETDEAILLASPGFTAAAFLAHILSDHSGLDSAAAAAARANKSRFIVAHAASGHMYALDDVLKSAEVQARLHHSRYARQAKLMDDFMTLLRRDDGWAWYGPGEVGKAVALGAVGKGGGKLLISLGLFRATDVATRQRYVALVDGVRDYGGEVSIMSDESEAGKRLVNLGGVAAILTYPLQDLEEPEADDDDGGGEEGEELGGVENGVDVAGRKDEW
ncbi:MAG: Translation factor pelota [Phylliscum demangeonii]|nr:MAG: Translation factor pelota [Phylliscum demangeonii]